MNIRISAQTTNQRTKLVGNLITKWPRHQHQTEDRTSVRPHRARRY